MAQEVDVLTLSGVLTHSLKHISSGSSLGWMDEKGLVRREAPSMETSQPCCVEPSGPHLHRAGFSSSIGILNSIAHPHPPALAPATLLYLTVSYYPHSLLELLPLSETNDLVARLWPGVTLPLPGQGSCLYGSDP